MLAQISMKKDNQPLRGGIEPKIGKTLLFIHSLFCHKIVKSCIINKKKLLISAKKNKQEWENGKKYDNFFTLSAF